jgi:SAM-dependent methyltransferase
MNDETTKSVREHYAQVAKKSSCCCGGGTADYAKNIGYSKEDVEKVPEGANLNLGCGNPLAFAQIKPGMTVMDLGSGAGLDCFLASPKVGASGKVIGIDMTTEMLDKARANAKKGDYANVEFRLGQIENIPSGNATVDLIISNCVINLSVDKPQVFREAFRVLKPGGKIMVSDIVLTGELPEKVLKNVDAYASCISGALQKDDYVKAIKDAGFAEVTIESEAQYNMGLSDDSGCGCNDPLVESASKELGMSVSELMELSKRVWSIKVSATKSA